MSRVNDYRIIVNADDALEVVSIMDDELTCFNGLCLPGEENLHVKEMRKKISCAISNTRIGDTVEVLMDSELASHLSKYAEISVSAIVEDIKVPLRGIRSESLENASAIQRVKEAVDKAKHFGNSMNEGNGDAERQR